MILMKYYPICDECVRAEGQECHNPECILIWHDVPTHPLTEEFGVEVEFRDDLLDPPREGEVIGYVYR